MEDQPVAGTSRTERHSAERSADQNSQSSPSGRRVVVVGAPEDIPRALEHPAVGAGRFRVVGALAVDVSTDSTPEQLDRLGRQLQGHAAEAILVAGPVGRPAMRRVADFALVHGCELLAVMPTEVPAGHDPVIVWSGDMPVVQLARVGQSVWARGLKRGMDAVVAGVGLILVSPLLIIFSVLIPLESRGWPIFAHERIGRYGKKFHCYKLRTMRPDAESELKRDAAMYEAYRRNHFKIPEGQDPRITRLGSFLRRTSLDELPQLWNVLTGEMSLVGPRPVVEEELRLYGSSADLLLSVRPGITGAWAANGRHDVGYPERCRIELNYVRMVSFGGDLRILSQTVQAVVHPGESGTG